MITFVDGLEEGLGDLIKQNLNWRNNAIIETVTFCVPLFALLAMEGLWYLKPGLTPQFGQTRM